MSQSGHLDRWHHEGGKSDDSKQRDVERLTHPNHCLSELDVRLLNTHSHLDLLQAGVSEVGGGGGGGLSLRTKSSLLRHNCSRVGYTTRGQVSFSMNDCWEVLVDGVGAQTCHWITTKRFHLWFSTIWINKMYKCRFLLRSLYLMNTSLQTTVEPLRRKHQYWPSLVLTLLHHRVAHSSTISQQHNNNKNNTYAQHKIILDSTYKYQKIKTTFIITCTLALKKEIYFFQS